MIKRHNKEGDPLVKAVTVKVFEPGNKKYFRMVQRAPKKQGYTPEGVSKILVKTADVIERQWPGQEFRLVVIGPAAFNFVHAGAIVS